MQNTKRNKLATNKSVNSKKLTGYLRYLELLSQTQAAIQMANLNNQQLSALI